MCSISPFFLSVIPAKPGIQGCKSAPGALDPGFRRGDDLEYAMTIHVR